MGFGCGLKAPHGGAFVLRIPDVVTNLGGSLIATIVSAIILRVVKPKIEGGGFGVREAARTGGALEAWRDNMTDCHDVSIGSETLTRERGSPARHRVRPKEGGGEVRGRTDYCNFA